MSTRGPADFNWFVAALAPMVASQLVRLFQTDAAAWITCDYAGRLGAVGVLVALPQARRIAFRENVRRIAWSETTLWVIGLILLARRPELSLLRWVDGILPDARIGNYPIVTGWLKLLDMSVGLFLVAFTEELLFRRCAGHVLGPMLQNRIALVLGTSFLFGAYHWWSGIGNILDAFKWGIFAMIFHQRCGVLWPLFLSHYLVDLAAFR